MPRPHKALVLSFHGWSGTGKNFVAQMLAENLYRDGLRSDCVKMFIAMFHFPHSQFVDLYKVRPGAAGEPRHPAAGATVKQTLLATLPCKKVGSREAGGGVWRPGSCCGRTCDRDPYSAVAHRRED
jgi:hypothetical protein